MKNKILPQCDKHGYDYRICCEKCQACYEATMKIINKTRKVWQK